MLKPLHLCLTSKLQRKCDKWYDLFRESPYRFADRYNAAIIYAVFPASYIHAGA